MDPLGLSRRGEQQVSGSDPSVGHALVVAQQPHKDVGHRVLRLQGGGGKTGGSQTASNRLTVEGVVQRVSQQGLKPGFDCTQNE